MFDKIKGKYEIILGFVTLVVSFSAFKSELEGYKIDLGYIYFSLAEYLLFCVVSFSICLYLYLLDKTFQDTKVGLWSIFRYTTTIAYLIFSAILLSPIFLFFNLLVIWIQQKFSSTTESEAKEIELVFSIINMFALIITAYYVRRFKKKQAEILHQIESAEREATTLSTAIKLIEHKFYGHAISEIFALLIKHLTYKLEQQGFVIPSNRFFDIIAVAKKEGLLSSDELQNLELLRNKRNRIAHGQEIIITESEAFEALNLARKILE